MFSVSSCSIISRVGSPIRRLRPSCWIARPINGSYLVTGRPVICRTDSGRLLNHYRPCEVRNSTYRYRKILIDYQSKFSYQFISTTLIIYSELATLAKMIIFFHIQLSPSDLAFLFSIPNYPEYGASVRRHFDSHDILTLGSKYRYD